jgi:hypothetical protein
VISGSLALAYSRVGAQRFIDPVEHASEEDGLSHPLAMPFGTFGCGKLDKGFGTSQRS